MGRPSDGDASEYDHDIDTYPTKQAMPKPTSTTLTMTNPYYDDDDDASARQPHQNDDNPTQREPKKEKEKKPEEIKKKQKRRRRTRRTESQGHVLKKPLRSYNSSPPARTGLLPTLTMTRPMPELLMLPAVAGLLVLLV